MMILKLTQYSEVLGWIDGLQYTILYLSKWRLLGYKILSKNSTARFAMNSHLLFNPTNYDYRSNERRNTSKVPTPLWGRPTWDMNNDFTERKDCYARGLGNIQKRIPCCLISKCRQRLTISYLPLVIANDYLVATIILYKNKYANY